jgi:hypothetical protein
MVKEQELMQEPEKVPEDQLRGKVNLWLKLIKKQKRR